MVTSFRIIYVCILILIHLNISDCYAYDDINIWSKLIGDQRNYYSLDVKLTSENKYVFNGGITSSDKTGTNILFGKTYNNGEIIWIKEYIEDGFQSGSNIEITSDGGYITAGYTDHNTAGYQDIVVIKTDSLGNLLWQKKYGTATTEMAHCIKETMDGSFILTGYDQSEIYNSIFAMKINNEGEKLWYKTYGYGEGKYIFIDNDNIYIFGGSKLMPASMLKISTDGDSIWNKSLAYRACIYAMIKTNDSKFLCVGEQENNFNIDILLLKTDISGDTMWTNTFGHAGSDRGSGVVETKEGDFILTGVFDFFDNSQLALIKTSSEGELIWEKSLGGSGRDGGEKIINADDGGFLIIGNTTSFSQGESDIWMIKTDRDGTNDIPSAVISSDKKTQYYIQFQNYPNPFNSSTTIEYNLERTNSVILSVYNILGECIEVLVHEKQVAGHYEVTWNASKHPTGIYYYNIKIGHFVETKKILYIK
jgi:hypothetical protein